MAQMANEKVMDLENRITNMTDAEICSILVEKEGWQEAVYKRAIEEAKKRSISMDQIQNKQSELLESQQAKKIEPLSKKERLQALLVPFAVYHWHMTEVFRSEGYESKLEEAKKLRAFGKVLWTFGILILVFVGVFLSEVIKSD
jgi:hypothetical protein